MGNKARQTYTTTSRGAERRRRSLSARAIATHLHYLESTLIPDLRESGRDAMAEDHETSVWIIRQLQGAAR